MNKNIRWITETAILLALLITLQTVTKPFGQLVTGSCVNGILAITVLFAGLGSGLVVAILSPILAFFLGIAPQALTVPAIMMGNGVYVLILHFMVDPMGKQVVRNVAGWLLGAVAKFGVLYLIVVKIVCGIQAQTLLQEGTLKAPMIEKLTATFTWPQLVTALVGGGCALLIASILHKALKKKS